jgi:hypothetical protein
MIVYNAISEAIGNKHFRTLVRNSVFSIRLVQHRKNPCFLRFLPPGCTLNIRFQAVNGYAISFSCSPSVTKTGERSRLRETRRT